MTVQQHSYIGRSPDKREDRVFLTGQGCYTDDVALSDPLHVHFVRSDVQCGKIIEIEIEDASQADGVLAIHVGAELGDLGKLAINPVLPMMFTPDYPILATQTVGAVGQPIAAVLAGTKSQAVDAAELVYADIADEPAQSRDLAAQHWACGDVDTEFTSAAHVVECTVQHPRLAPSPMEPRAIAVAYDDVTQSVTVWHSTQTPHRTRSELAAILGLDAGRIRVIASHVGGAFGMKASLYPEDVFTVWAAFHHKRDVKWTATRSEEFLSATHGRGVTSHGQLAFDEDGTFLALRADVSAPLGAWVPNSGLITGWNAARVLPSGYLMPALDISTKAVMTNLAPTGIYRGAGRPEANVLMERLIDKAARVLHCDPFEIRERNLLDAAALPHETATGNVLDSGSYAQALSMLKEKAGYDACLSDRDARRAQGELVGVGVAFYVEPSGNGWESARVTWDGDGRVQVASGSSSQGHGRETSFAQIAADVLNVSIDRVDVTMADTATSPEGIGALASRSTAIGGSAVLKACEEIKARHASGEALPLSADIRYENKGQAWGYGAYLVVLSVDRETGTPRLERVTCVDDAGRIINPSLVDGQIRGGFAQGLGEALMECVVYDEDGQLLTGSFMDYALPRALDVPALEIHKIETPSPMNALGAKGVGEAGTIGAPAAILNAAVDALSPLGVRDLTMPLTSQTLWQAMWAAEQGNAT